ncbi:MAG: hypothetical protein SO445_05945 [Lachnospiraceae bacterium]|nr:hypothetical protein [Lachnospiraceae bacterium]MDD7377539.1 hypothetical protein [Lachnospiraceae bacterium]MDY4617236.1 hypothetical protein [Lachnospiraceae bacterium]
MKRIWKWVVCMTLLAAMAVTVVMPGEVVKAAETEDNGLTEYTTSCDMAQYIYQGYYHCDTGVNLNSKGPIAIAPATLVKTNVWGKEVQTQVYIVGLAGTEFIFNQPRGVITDLQVGFEKDNYYMREIRKVVCKVVPKGSNVIFTGHSLGGMVAQQASGDTVLKARYNILNTVSFGSPLINPVGREGQVKRLGDTADIVPYLSAQSVLRPIHQIAGLNREDGGYGRDFAEAHMRSYLRTDVWGDYDVLGVKGGNARILINESEIESYGAYIIPWLKDLPTIDLSWWS